jgi:hypothetical protein
MGEKEVVAKLLIVLSAGRASYYLLTNRFENG